jgi:hypothetical protein
MEGACSSLIGHRTVDDQHEQQRQSWLLRRTFILALDVEKTLPTHCTKRKSQEIDPSHHELQPKW